VLQVLNIAILFRSFILFIALLGAAQAETRYVSDELTITVRSGEDSSYRVLKELKAGTKVELLNENSETGYSRIRTPDGTEGFSLTRYLMNQTPARVRAAELEKKLEEIQSDPQGIQQKFNELQSEYQSLKLRYDSLEFENVQLSQRMEAIRENAANVVALMNERDEVLQRANRLSTELDELRVKNMELENHSDKKWFMAGAGVLIFGVLIGVILPRVSGRRRSGWRSNDFSL